MIRSSAGSLSIEMLIVLSPPGIAAPGVPLLVERQQSEVRVKRRRAPASRPNTIRAVGIPNLARSIRNTYGSLSSSGCSCTPR